MSIYNPLQIREIFHLEFLRWFTRKIQPKHYALKGGANLRFFFGSIRYSEDMDLDISGIAKDILKDAVMEIITAASFNKCLNPFGISRVVPPDMTKAKQTETTQRFKIHLITTSGEDLFTKVEFSRRGFKNGIVVQPVSESVTIAYKLPPLVVPHYDAKSAIAQKVAALGARPMIQARDIFDLYILSSQVEKVELKGLRPNKDSIARALRNLFEVDFGQFRDTVVLYLSAGDEALYSNETLWEEIKLKVASFIKRLGG